MGPDPSGGGNEDEDRGAVVHASGSFLIEMVKNSTEDQTQSMPLLQTLFFAAFAGGGEKALI